MHRLFLAAALTGAVLACSPAAEPEPPAAPPTAAAPDPLTIPADPAAGPSGIDNMTWTFDQNGRTENGVQRPRLMYHSGGSEGLAINLQCDAATNTAHVFLWRGEQRPVWRFSLLSGTARADLEGATSGESEVTVHASLPLDAPVMAAFRAGGVLTLIDGDLTLPMDAINATERQAIASFFACA